MNAHIQQTRAGKYRVVLVGSNGKLIMAGEALENGSDARDIKKKILSVVITSGSDIGPSYKFVKNSGPKKKAAKKAATKKK